MTTYQLNNATINGDTCAVSAEACLIGLGSPLGSFEEMVISGVVCGIHQRILKTGQIGPFDSARLFALPVKEMRTIKALFSQVKVTSGTCLRMVQNFLENLNAASAKSQAVFAKYVLGPILGLNNPVEAVSK